jgi:O-antigen/teichoic acid export membrane protein
MQKAQSLSQRTFRALGWKVSTEVASVVLQLVVEIILAHLLAVAAFGLMAAAMIVIQFSLMVSEVGMAPALIQRKDLTRAHINTGFTITVLGGVALFFVLLLVAPLVGVFAGNPAVVPMVQVLSLMFLFISLSSTGAALLQRELDFRKLFIVDVGSYLVGRGLVGVWLALTGAGVWALIWSAVAEAAVRVVLVFSLSSVRPRLELRREEARQLLGYGVANSMIRVIHHCALNADYVVVLGGLGTVPLALYQRAYQLMKVPSTQLSFVLYHVLFPVYAELQDDLERLRRAFFGAVSATAFVVYPIMAVLAVVAPELIRGLFGAKWAPATLAFQVLCVGGLFRCHYQVADALARAKGAIYQALYRHVIYAVAVVICALVGLRWGIAGVAAGVTAALALQAAMVTQLSLRELKAGWGTFAASQIPGVVLMLLVGAVSLFVATGLRWRQMPDVVLVVGPSLAAGATVLAALRFFPATWVPSQAQVLVKRVPALGRFLGPRAAFGSVDTPSGQG